MPSIDQLERLCDEYSIALRLEQHKKVGELCLAICDKLILTFDDELLQNDIEEENEVNQEEPEDRRLADIINSNEWELVDLICQRLRKQSILAQANEDVLQFVRQQDRICLDKLLEKQVEMKTEISLDHHLYTKVLRQSILLLKELQRRSTPEKFPPPNWLPTARITRLNDVAFSRYSIDLNQSQSASQEGTSNNPINDVLERCISECLSANNADESPGSELESSSHFYKLISSSWFRDFIDRSHSMRFYGYDKFIILIAIWIVASQCQHIEMERLLNELVGEMFHQETNSSNLDEFLLLTQAGAVWLSYKKRMLVSLQQLGSSNFPAASDEEPAEVFEESPTHHGNIMDSSSSESMSRASESEEGSMNEGFPENELARRQEKEQAEMRAIIDNELLLGKQCILCDWKPDGQPMGPIQLAKCPSCSLQLKPANLHLNYCHSSFQSLDWLLPLDCLEFSLKLAKLKHLLVLTPNEWVQRALEACSELLGKRFTLFDGIRSDQACSKSAASEEDRSENSERVEISDNFERLTLVRRAPSDQVVESSDGEESDSNDHSSQNGVMRDQLSLAEDEEFANFSDGGQSSESGHSELEVASGNVRAKVQADCLADLEAFFRWRYGRVAALGKQRPLPDAMELVGETVQAAKRAPDCEMLAVNSAELLAIDSLDDSIRLLLVAGRERAPQALSVQCAGRSAHARKRQRAQQVAEVILGCLARSQTSQLQRGCARLFLRPALAEAQTRPSQPEASASGVDAPSRGANGRDMALNGRPNELASFSAECPACGQPLIELRAGNFAQAAASL